MIAAVIPGRIGSKRIPRKNLKPLGGRPLIAWTIEAAVEAESIDRTVVSTDSPEIAALAESMGAEWIEHPPVTPGLEASGVVIDAVTRMDPAADSVAMMLATAPFRTAEHVDEAVALHLGREPHPRVLSCVRDPLTKHKTWSHRSGYLQDPELEDALTENGAILIARTDLLVERGWFDGHYALPYLMDRVNGYDIDWPEDWHRAERIASERRARQLTTNGKPLTVVVDLDGTLCTFRADGNYDLAEPIPHVIARIREIREAGHRIIVDTGRGSGTGKDWLDLTVKQLIAWGVPFDDLHVGEKLVADVYIDDRALNPNVWTPEG